MKLIILIALSVVSIPLPAAQSGGSFCPEIYSQRVIELPFNPAFLHVDSFNAPGGSRQDGLLMSSF